MSGVALLHLDRQIRELAEGVAQPTWIFSRDGACEFVNRHWCELTALSRERSAGGGWLDALLPEGRRRWREAWDAATARGERFELDVPVRTEAGECRPFRLRVQPLLTGDGHLAGWVGTATPIVDDSGHRTAPETPAPHSRAIPPLGADGAIVEWLGVASDITARRPSEESLDVTRRRLEAALEASQIVLFHQDRELRYTWVHNPKHGLCAQDVLGRRDVELMQRAHDAHRTEAMKRNVMATGTARREEVSIVHDGVTHFYDLLVQPEVDARGDVTGVRGAALDITARKRSEEAVRLAGAAFRQLVEQSPFGVYAVDADFRLVMVSAGARKVFEQVRPLLGRDFEEVLRILWPEPFVSETIRQFRETLATGRSYHSSSTVEQRADIGETEAYDWRIERYMLPDGRPGVVCHFYDLSERQRYESALRASEHRHRTLVAATGAVTWACPPTGLHVEAQPSWSAFTGQASDEVLGDGWVAAVHPEDRARAAETWNRAVTSGEVFKSEHRVRRHDGAWRWMEVTATPIRDDSGRIVEWFGASVDITDRKRNEEQLRDADRKKDEFLAMLGHELRNPLAPIWGAVAMMKTRQVTDPMVIRCRDVIDRQVAHMTRLLDDLLDISRLSRGKLTLQRSRLCLDEVLSAAAESALPHLEQRGQTLVMADAEHVILDGDPARLTQVFGNLLTNASKYSPSGAEVVVDVQTAADDVIVRVRDTGDGIAPEHLESVFELFAQFGPADQAVSSGLGIGLALVKRLVDLHGGTITAASDGVGRGSTFTVRLPLVSADAVRR